MPELDQTADITSQINTLSEAIFKFGTSTVIIATGIVVFIVAMIIIFKSNAKQSKEMTDSNKELMKCMLDQNERMLNFMMDKNGINKIQNTEPRLVDAYIDVSISLKSICKSMLAKLNCSKVSVYVFHNGNVSNYGLPFFKMSCIGEWSLHDTNFNRAKIKSDFPLYIFDEMVQSIYNNGEYIISDISSLNENSNIFELIHSGTKSFVAFNISDDQNNIAGFTLVEFRDIHDFESPKELDEIRAIVEDNNETISDIIIDSEINRKIHDTGEQ